jgi:hypothetical protein
MSENRECSLCHKAENIEEDGDSELRPYGPGGSLLCAPCAMSAEGELKETLYKNMEEAVNKALDPILEEGKSGFLVFGDGPPQFVSPEQAKEN